MVNYHKQIVTALKTVLPTHFEMTMKNELIPCITYLEISNNAEDEGNTLGYSRISYQIKIWALTIAEIQEYAMQIDNVMRGLGFKRTSGGEAFDDNSPLIQKILVYEALALEEFN